MIVPIEPDPWPVKFDEFCSVPAGYSYSVWNTHEANIINAMGSQTADKQIMTSMPSVSGGPYFYAVSNLGAAVAAAPHVGFSFEDLGVSNVALPRPGPPRAIPKRNSSTSIGVRLYPEEWLQADSPSSPGFVPANQASYKAALQAASLILGATNGREGHSWRRL